MPCRALVQIRVLCDVCTHCRAVRQEFSDVFSRVFSSVVLLLSAQQPTTHLTKHLTKRLRERLRELNTCIAELQHSSRHQTKHLTIRLIPLKPWIYNDWLGPALLTQLAGRRLTRRLIQLNTCTAGLQQRRRLEGTPNKTPH